jgi:hypothetical protein
MRLGGLAVAGVAREAAPLQDRRYVDDEIG